MPVSKSSGNRFVQRDANDSLIFQVIEPSLFVNVLTQYLIVMLLIIDAWRDGKDKSNLQLWPLMKSGGCHEASEFSVNIVFGVCDTACQ